MAGWRWLAPAPCPPRVAYRAPGEMSQADRQTGTRRHRAISATPSGHDSGAYTAARFVGQGVPFSSARGGAGRRADTGVRADRRRARWKAACSAVLASPGRVVQSPVELTACTHARDRPCPARSRTPASPLQDSRANKTIKPRSGILSGAPGPIPGQHQEPRWSLAALEPCRKKM